MPYQSHPNCHTPPDDTIIWRYLDLPKLIDLLELKSLWLARLDLLADRREGRATTREFAQLKEQQYGHELIGMNEGMRSVGCVNCWFEGTAESTTMWSIYGRGIYSVAVKSTIGALKNALKSSEIPVYISKMQYLNWADHADWPGNAIAMALRKSLEYQDEREVRLYCFNSMIAPNVSNPTAELPSEGLPIPVDTTALVDELVVGPEGPHWVMDLVIRLTTRFALQHRVRWSKLRPEIHEY